jgi:hypothetical protein
MADVVVFQGYPRDYFSGYIPFIVASAGIPHWHKLTKTARQKENR